MFRHTCPICGETYTVVSGSQTCCKTCAKKLTIRFNVPKGEGDKIKTYAQEHGMAVKNLMLAALGEYMKKRK